MTIPASRPHVLRFATILAAALAVAFGLRFGFGQRWFSFYGLAAVALVILPFLSTTVLAAHRERNWRRWPIWLLIAMTAVTALTQIGFWLAFFHAGSGGLGLAIGRAMFKSLFDAGGAWLVIALATLWLILIARITFRIAPSSAP